MVPEAKPKGLPTASVPLVATRMAVKDPRINMFKRMKVGKEWG